MTKTDKLKICDWTLAGLLPVVLASSIQLEATDGGGTGWMIVHVIVASAFMCTILWHIYLHFQWKKWLVKFAKQKIATRILWWLYVLTLLSGIAAFIHRLIEINHGPLGGIHGKIGFLMIAFAIGHTLKRIKFFKRKR
ncbi:MAG: hypothetical protein K2K68_04240 [Duncaniella sp.]|nr:hypothetical protein [Duncaniella sp.]